MKTRLLPRAARRAFTLVELIVAMTAGLFVALAAFLLSKNSTRFFQHEARIASAQIAATLGINRIAADLQRASFLSTPNSFADPMMCGDKATWPDSLKKLAGIQINLGGSVTSHPIDLAQSTQNGNNLNPDSLLLGGAFDSTEQFPVRAIQPGGGGGLAIYLQTDSAPMQRALSGASAGQEGLQEIFKAKRFLRLVDTEGREEWGVITSVATGGTPISSVIVNLAAAPAVQQRTPGTTCGYTGFGTGVLANVVSRIRYDLRSLAANPTYGPSVAPVSAQMSGDAGRTELVRVEVDTDGNEDPTTLELVAEYAVDLKFGITVANPPYNNPTLSRYAITVPENANVYNMAGDVTNGAQPERVRSVMVRLSTRSRAPDRDADVPMGPLNVADGRKFRFLIDPNMPDPKYARLRTHYAEVYLPNQSGLTW